MSGRAALQACKRFLGKLAAQAADMAWERVRRDGPSQSPPGGFDRVGPLRRFLRPDHCRRQLSFIPFPSRPKLDS